MPCSAEIWNPADGTSQQCLLSYSINYTLHFSCCCKKKKKKNTEGGGRENGGKSNSPCCWNGITPSSWLAPTEFLLQGHLHYYCSITVFLMTRQVLMYSHKNSLLSSVVLIPSITNNNRQTGRLIPIATRRLWNYEDKHLQFNTLFPFQIFIPNT